MEPGPLVAEVDGRRLSPAERQAFFLLLWFAGHETVRGAVAGGLVALRENPDQLARLLADPGLTATAADEMVRWTTPISYFRRTVARDTELGGRRLSEGDWVVMYLLRLG